jgi:hypothetical protein
MAEGEAPSGSRPLVARWIVGFGHFWWDFLIGDTPELFVGALVVVGSVALLCLDHSLRTAAALVLPVLVAALLGASVWKAGRKRPS